MPLHTKDGDQIIINAYPKAFEAICNGILWGMAAVCVLGVILDIWGPRDDSDSAQDRSGFTIRTDHGTGVQYLQTPRGLTPRLNADGTLHLVKP